MLAAIEVINKFLVDGADLIFGVLVDAVGNTMIGVARSD